MRVLFCVFALFALALGVFAQGEEPQITAAADVITTSLFPRFPNKEIPLGHVTEVLLNFKNTGRHTYNVTAIRGFLMFPNDQVNFLQNFSAFRYDQIAPPGYEISFSYLFYPDELHEERDYVFFGDVLYHDEAGTNYITPFHNGTIVLIDASHAFELQYIFTYVLLLAILGGLGYLVYRLVFVKRARKMERSSAPAVPAVVDRNDWLSASNVAQWKKTPKKQK